MQLLHYSDTILYQVLCDDIETHTNLLYRNTRCNKRPYYLFFLIPLRLTPLIISFYKLKVRKGSWAQWFMPIILATQELEIRSIMVPGQPRPKVCKTPSQQWHMPVIPATVESINRRTVSRLAWAQSDTLFQK
jgi:hypothetical protein